MVPASSRALMLLPVIKQFVFRMTSITLSVSSEQGSTNPWPNKNLLGPQESSTLTLTSATFSNKLSLRVYEVLLTRYFFYYYCQRLQLHLLQLLCASSKQLQKYAESYLVHQSTFQQQCPKPIKRHAKTNKRLISKKGYFLFNMLTELFVLNFKHFSF